MGPVDWLAVLLAAALAFAVGALWHRWLPGGGAGRRFAPVLTFVLLLVSAAMMGHMFARVGAATLAEKPWLYAMMSGGLALAFVVPAVAIDHARDGRPLGRTALDAGQWLAGYLAMGAAFWALG